MNYVAPRQWNNQNRYGYCQDTLCDNKKEASNLRLLNGKYVCDGCYEAELDNEDFINANRLDMQEAGY